jgi:hypothetical protein
MPHAAAALITAWLRSSAAPNLPSVDASNAQAFSSALMADGIGLQYSALLTLADSLRGIKSGYFSWAIVKLYYCCFYAARTILCASRIAIFYQPNGTPYSLSCVPGGVIKKEKGQTHKLVWSILRREFSSNPLLNLIGQTSADAWMMALREEANYRNPKFPDPVIPAHFSKLDTIGISRSLHAYISDNAYIYCFDADHAVVAFAVECIKHSQRALKRVGLQFSNIDQNHLHSCLITADVDAVDASLLLT